MHPVRPYVRSRPGALLLALAVLTLTLVTPGAAGAASWTQRRVADTPPSAMTVDDLGHVHVITDRGGRGLRYSTDASGTWRNTNITNLGAEGQVAIALSAGKVYVVFNRIFDCPADDRGCRTDPNQGLYLATNRSGAWRTQRLAGTRPAYSPSLRMRNGKLHIAYNDITGIRYLTNASGTWSNHRVWSVRPRLTSSATTSIALDTAGRPFIAFMRTRCSEAANFGWCARRDTILRGVFLSTRVAGAWATNMASDPRSMRDVLDRVVIDRAGTPLVGYTHRLASGALRFRVTRFSEMDSLASRTLPGTGYGSFTLDPSGRIELVRWSGDRLTWRAERGSGWVQRSWSAPRVSVAWVRSSRGVTTIVRDGFASSVPAYATWVLTRR